METFLSRLGTHRVTEDAALMPPIKLAYIGDTIYDLHIRAYVLSRYNGPINQLNKRVIGFVNATAQAKAVLALKDSLTETEWKMVKKGRNQKTATSAKNKSITDYRYATGFEALLGYLYLSGENGRLEEVIAMAVHVLEEKDEEASE